MQFSIFDPILSRCVARFLRMLTDSLRWEFVDEHARTALTNLDRPVIFVFWHNQQLMMPALYVRIGGELGKIAALISRHRDGRLIAQTVKHLGIESVAGSSTRGKVAALRGLSEALERRMHTAITPDGPRGPRYRAKLGAAQLAKLSGAPILPVCTVPRYFWEFNSWDRMVLPKPFSPIALGVAQPLWISSDASDEQLEEATARLEQMLKNLNAKACEAIGARCDEYDFLHA